MKPIPESRDAKAPMMHAIPISPNIIIPINIPKTPTIINKIPIILILCPPVQKLLLTPKRFTMYLPQSVQSDQSNLVFL